MTLRGRLVLRLAVSLTVPLVFAPTAPADDECADPPCEEQAPPSFPFKLPPGIKPPPPELIPPIAPELEDPEQEPQGLLDAREAVAVEAMDTCGDGISKAFNGHGSFPCSNADEEQFNYATSDTHRTDFCGAGQEGVFSIAERVECVKQRDIVTRFPGNSAASGAQLLKDFVNQTNRVKSYLLEQPAPRFVPVLLGHNDLCGGTVWRFNFSCPRGSDQDNNNYCRTTPAAFERELRKGLDVLITVPDTRIGVASLVRVSQLCNHGGKTNCQIFTPCQDLWSLVAYTGWIFGQANGICGSLTVSCSSTRVRHAYDTARAFRDVLARVSAEYANVPPGSPSRVVRIGGQWVGGAGKAIGVTVAYSDAPWRYRFTAGQLNCCDCFHPSPSGQNAAARVLYQGFTCTPSEPCCRDTGDSYRDGRCLDTITDGTTFIPGLLN